MNEKKRVSLKEIVEFPMDYHTLSSRRNERGRERERGRNGQKGQETETEKERGRIKKERKAAKVGDLIRETTLKLPISFDPFSVVEVCRLCRRASFNVAFSL